MGISRKAALIRINGLIERAQEHLDKLTRTPSLFDDQHWRHEMNNWLAQMEEVLRHVGKKTGRKWQAVFDEIKRKATQADVPDNGT